MYLCFVDTSSLVYSSLILLLHHIIHYYIIMRLIYYLFVNGVIQVHKLKALVSKCDSG